MTQIELVKRNQKIKHLAQEGKTADEIAEIMNINRARVMRILRSYNVKPGKKSHSLKSVTAQNIIAELKKGTKQSDIAKKYYVSRQYVSLIKHKIEGK